MDPTMRLRRAKAMYDAADALHITLTRTIHPDRNLASGKLYEARKELHAALDEALADPSRDAYAAAWVDRWLEATA